MNETAQIPARIKQARKMANFNTQAKLADAIADWKTSRIGNYESGVSTPSPNDMLLIAQATDVSPCWLMFGLGPIRPNERDLQAVRHQNLSRAAEHYPQLADFAAALDISEAELQAYLDNPFQVIEDDLARRCEQVQKKNNGWMDEQHIEDDPLCMAFPETMRELMMIYSALGDAERALILDLARSVERHKGGHTSD